MSCEENNSVELTDQSETFPITLTTDNHGIVPRKPPWTRSLQPKILPARTYESDPRFVRSDFLTGYAGPSSDPVSHRLGLLGCEQEPSHLDVAKTLWPPPRHHNPDSRVRIGAQQQVTQFVCRDGT